jgi:hypothetical protein
MRNQSTRMLNLKSIRQNHQSIELHSHQTRIAESTLQDSNVDLDSVIQQKIAYKPHSVRLKSIKKPKKSLNQCIHTETKITKTLAIIMTSFLVCWLPFFVVYIIRSLLKDPSSVPGYTLDFVTWLGYSKSSLDPLLYYVLNKHFKYSFTQLIKCNWSHLHCDLAKSRQNSTQTCSNINI